MKTRIIAIWIIIALMLSAICGCTATIDTGTTNDKHYKNYHFWEQDNQLRLVTHFSVSSEIEDNFQNEISGVGEKELTEKEMKRIKKLQVGIIKFFQKYYGINLEEKISHQKIRIFDSQQSGSMTMGYVYDKEPDVLNLNSLLFGEYSDLFSNTYIHETLHQLGLRNADKDGMLVEGLADAYTDIILTEMGKRSYTTESYFEARTLAYQLIAVDEELPHLFFEKDNFSLSERITERLRDVPKVHRKVKKPGEELVNILQLLFSNNQGMLVCNTDPYFYAYDAQDLVRSYCQTFNPSHEKIDYIRSHYLIDDYESLEFEKDDRGGYWVK